MGRGVSNTLLLIIMPERTSVLRRSLAVMTACLGVLVAARSVRADAPAVEAAATRRPASLTLYALTQPYDGTRKSIGVATAPAGLPVTVTYNGDTALPVLPGRYDVVAAVADGRYRGMVSASLTITVTAFVRHAPQCDGEINGSLELATPESVTLTDSVAISGDLLVPGSPSLLLAGLPMIADSRDETGSPEPRDYSISLNGSSVLRCLVRRVQPPMMPSLAAPDLPATARDVVVNSFTATASANAADRSTVAAPVAPHLDGGTYRDVSVQAGAELILGHAGATAPDVYALRSLALHEGASLQLAGPVVLVVSDGVDIKGDCNDPAHARWLTLAIAKGDLDLGPGATLSGLVLAPAGCVAIANDAVLVGEITSDTLLIDRTGLLAESAP